MATKFSQFNSGGDVAEYGDIVVGLRGGVNTQFNAQALAILPWSTLTSGQPLVVNNGYFMANTANANYTLPSVCSAGQILQIINNSVFSVTIAQNAGQQIWFGNIATTVGVLGSIVSDNKGDSITLICSAANSQFMLLGAPQGNWVIN